MSKLIDIFWKLMAFVIVKYPFITKFIINSAQKRPYYHLTDYMDRWWLTPRFLLTKDEDGYLVPYPWLPMIFKIRLHHIKRADNDRHLHDHPADNRSILLKGFYKEENIFGEVKLVLAGQTVNRRAETFHKIFEVSSGGVWSLWFLSEKRNEWGFLVDGKKIHNKKYVDLFGSEA